MQQKGWHRSFFWRRPSANTLKRAILKVSAAERRAHRELRGDYPRWRHLRKRMVAHYAKEVGHLPGLLLSEQLPLGPFGLSGREMEEWLKGA